MAASTSSFQRTMKTFKDTSTPDSKTQALTSLRRIYLEDQKSIKVLKDEEFCELCNAIITTSITDDEKLFIEACRTLDIILPETRNKNFDFFQSILQINRKKRLKILVSLSILKDETVALVANNKSILEFLNNCLQSIQPKSMVWLLPENADNAVLMKNVENLTLNEDEEFEEKVVERALQFLSRLCGLCSIGLNIRQFDHIIMDKVILLGYMGHRRQRTQALIVLQQSVKNDLGTRMKSIERETWEKYKTTLQNVYCKRMSLLVNLSDQDWASQWETSIALIGSDLHRGSGLVNSILKVEELAFKSADPNRRQAFLSWKLLIDNFALDQHELATSRRIKLLCVPLNAKNSKTEVMVLTKLEVWWHLIYKIYPSLSECIDNVLIPFINMCFGPFGEKPLFIQKNDSNVSLGKKFPKTQIFAIDAIVQLIVNKEDESKAMISSIEKLPEPVNNAVFERVYKIFIHAFGEILLSLGLLPNEDVKNKSDIYKAVWNSLIKRIEEYDKMKVSMYKEVTSVIIELIKKRFYKLPTIKDFLFNVVLKDFDQLATNMQFSETVLMEFTHTFLQVDHFSYLTNDHYQSIESLLWHLIKPKHSDAYYPQTMELMQAILKLLESAKKINTNESAVCELWCVLARTVKKFTEGSQNINEGTRIEHNFKTIEDILIFPFTSIFISDHAQWKAVAEAWQDLYKQFDFLAELIVSVKSNEILNKTSNMIIAALNNDRKCCDFAAICLDALLSTVNYDNLSTDKEVPPFVQLLKDVTLQCLNSNSFATDRALRALSAFLLRVFSHSVEATSHYLKIVEPVAKCMLARTDDNNQERDITSTWSTIVGLFKKLAKSLTYELLNSYKQSIVLAMLHLNIDISSVAFSLLDLKESLDEKSKKVLEEIINELKETSVKNNYDIGDMKEKSKKVKGIHVKPIGSFLNRKTMSPSNTITSMHNEKDNTDKSKVVQMEPDSQDFVEIKTDIKLDVTRLTEHQKEMLKKRRDDIPAMYNELTVSNSQDTQELQHWFDAKTGKPSPVKGATLSNNNEETKSTSTSMCFKNIVQVFENDKEKIVEKPVAAAADPSPKAEVEKQPEVLVAPTIEDSQKKAPVEPAPIVAKKLDFESRDEYPSEAGQISPSIIDNAKMRRRSHVEESIGTSVVQDKNVRATRRSLQPQPQRGTLRKFNSTEQLNKRGKKRRNSESSSEGMLGIEREKRARRESTPPAILNSSTDSAKSGEDKNTDGDGKKYTKRQMNEMSRLKIDMRFEPLPSRRSVGKINETANIDKKSATSKEEKSKEDKSSAANKPETNSQQQQNNINKRRSLKSSTNVLPKIEEKADVHRKDSGHKKLAASESTETSSKVATRRSGLGRIDNALSKKKTEIPETPEENDIEDVATQIEPLEKEKIDDSSVSDKCSVIEINESAVADIKSSQDSDIVESSQEPTFSSKVDKVECFIKIKKVEVTQALQTVKNSEEVVIEKEEKEKITETTVDLDETGVSVIPATVEPEKPAPVQPETKKIENHTGKLPIPPSHSSSPKSSTTRIFKSKAFPLQGRAAQMLGLVTKQSIAEKLSSEVSFGKSDPSSSDDVTPVSITKRDKTSGKDCDRVLSPSTGSSGSRQEKMFSNMNQSMRQEMCSSPAMTMFCNLRNDGERISPKLDKHEQRDNDTGDKESITVVTSDDSPNGKVRRELPLLEWSNANPPSLTASPSASILKRMQEADIDTPNRKKRVSFADPPVSREMGYEIMTESSSPPKLEKLPSLRSPISRKDFKKHAKLRLVHVEADKLEKENEDLQTNIAEEEPMDVSVSNSPNAIPLSAKIKLATVLSVIPSEESKITEVEANHTQDVDMFVDQNNVTNNEESTNVPKTSTQTEQNNSPIKLDSINLSHILHKSSDNQQNSLEDTVDVNNMSSSLTSTSNLSDRPIKSCSQQSGEPSDTLPVTDSVFSNLPLSQETQNSVAQLNEPENLDSTLPVYPSLISCVDTVESISGDLVDPLFTNNLAKHLSVKSIRSIGDLAQLTERDINRLPIKSPKIPCLKKALSRYEERQHGNKTPERRTTNVVSSSTPLGNKCRDKNRDATDSFDDLMKSNSNTIDLASINVSALYDNKMSSKRRSTDSSMQTSPVKKPKKSDEEVCTEFMDKCDDAFLFEAFVKKFDAERILKGYRKKMSDKTEKELKRNTLEILGLSMEDDSEESFKASTKTAGLQKVLRELPKIFNNDDEFFDSVLKTYKKKLNPDAVLKVLQPDGVKSAITNKFSSSELLGILAKRLSQEKETDGEVMIADTNDLKVVLDSVSLDSIINQLRTKTEFKSSEALLNLVLENCTEKLKENKKNAIFKILTDNVDICVLADMYNEVIKMGVRKMQKK